MACLAAAGAHLLERGLDFAGDPVLRIKLEAEEAAHRDHDRSGQAHQYLYHSLCSGADIAGGKFAILSVKGMG